MFIFRGHTVLRAPGIPCVFLCGMNEGVFPSRRTRTLPAMEEERRLAFVALTRAEGRLYLTGAEGRALDGSPRYPSRFVLDIDPALLEYARPPHEGLVADAREYIAASERSLPESQTVFDVGDRVEHPVLGPGTVTEVDTGKGVHIVKFDRVATTRAISFRARLKRL